MTRISGQFQISGEFQDNFAISGISGRVKKNPGFFKSPTQWVFGFYWVFLDKQEKIGKIIQKLSNLKP